MLGENRSTETSGTPHVWRDESGVEKSHEAAGFFVKIINKNSKQEVFGHRKPGVGCWQLKYLLDDFHPILGWDDPIWAYFSNGWVEKAPTRKWFLWETRYLFKYMLDFHGVMIHGLFLFLTSKLERSATNALTDLDGLPRSRVKVTCVGQPS